MKCKNFCEIKRKELREASVSIKGVRTMLRTLSQSPDLPLDVSSELNRICFALSDSLIAIDKSLNALAFLPEIDCVKGVDFNE